MTTPPVPGWYEDPQQPTHERWWDGNAWGPRRVPGAAPQGAATAAPPKSKGWGGTIVLAIIVIAVCIWVFNLNQDRNKDPDSLADACSYAQQVGAAYTSDVVGLDPYDVASVQRNGAFYAEHGPQFMDWGVKLNAEKDGAGVPWNNVGVVMTTAGQEFPAYDPNDISAVTVAEKILNDLNDYLLKVEKACG